MAKISFFLKKPNDNQGSLENITIADPKIDKSIKPEWGNCYNCEVYFSDIKKTMLYYGVNPIDTFCLASECVKMYLQSLIARGFIVSESENHEPWRLEKKDPQLLLQEKIDAIKNNKDMSPEDKQKILKILKESFSKTVIKEQLDKLI